MRASLPFADRLLQAGRQLATALAAYRGRQPLVLAIPRGALPIGRAVADALAGELDVVQVRKLGAPWNPELAIGAINEQGERYLSPYARQLDLDPDWIEQSSPQGEVWANTGKVHGYYTKLAPDLYPDQERIEALVRTRSPHLYLLPAAELAQETGSPQAVNMVMLGAFCKANSVLKLESVTWAIEESNQKFAASNLEAFRKGYDFLETVSHRKTEQLSLHGS